jgi:O-antigen/teichoic acid export membrane protein
MPIRKSVKDIGKQSSIYGLGRIAVKLTALVLIPLYTNYISIYEIGILALFELTEVLLMALLPLGVFQGIWRHLTEADPKQQNKIIISGFVGLFITTTLFITLGYLSIDVFMGFLNINPKYLSLYKIVFINVGFQLGIQFTLQLWRYEQKSVQFIVATFFQFLGITTTTILLITQFNYGLNAAVFGKSIILLPLFIISIFYVLFHYWVKPSFHVFKRQLIFGLPLIIGALSTPILSISDRYFLNIFLPLEQVGIYNIVYKFGMIINMLLVTPLIMGIGPFMYRLKELTKEHNYFSDIMFYYSVLGSVFVIIISILTMPMIALFSTEEYLVAANIVPIITVAYLINGYKTFFAISIAIKNKTIIVGIIATIGIIANLILNYFLIQKFNLIGAAWATIISYFLITMMYYILAKPMTDIDWDMPRILKSMMSLTISIGIFYANNQYNILNEFVCGFSILGIYFILLIFTKALSQKDIESIRYIFRKILFKKRTQTSSS